MMKKSLLGFALIILIVCLLAATNPDKGDFAAWVACGGMNDGKQDVLSKAGAVVAAPFLGAATTRQNCFIFSLYRTDLAGEKRTTVGIAGLFIKL